MLRLRIGRARKGRRGWRDTDAEGGPERGEVPDQTDAVLWILAHSQVFMDTMGAVV